MQELVTKAPDPRNRFFGDALGRFSRGSRPETSQSAAARPLVVDQCGDRFWPVCGLSQLARLITCSFVLMRGDDHMGRGGTLKLGPVGASGWTRAAKAIANPVPQASRHRTWPARDASITSDPIRLSLSRIVR